MINQNTTHEFQLLLTLLPTSINCKKHIFLTSIHSNILCNIYYIRGRFDNSLASPSEGSTIAREIYYLVVHSRRRLLSKFQSNRTRSFVLTAPGNGCARGFYKNGKGQHQSVIQFLFWKVNRAAKSKSALMLYTVSPLLQWRPSKIGLTSFNMVA